RGQQQQRRLGDRTRARRHAGRGRPTGARPHRSHRDALPHIARAPARRRRARRRRGDGSLPRNARPHLARDPRLGLHHPPVHDRRRSRCSAAADVPRLGRQAARREPRTPAVPVDRLVVGGARVIHVRSLARLLTDHRPPEPPPLAALRPRFMGEDLVVYRTRGGILRVVEPYCPHLGAHLGHGGRVEGEQIVCPFHHFAFGPDGSCVRTGYGTRPPAMRLTQREAREVNDAIFVWHHAEGAPPRWEIPALPREGFPSPFRHVATLVDHPQEVVENAVDTGHFGPLHGYRNTRARRPFQPDGPFFAFAASGDRAFPLGGSVKVLFDIVAHGLGHIWATAELPRLRTAAVFQAMATPL